MPRGSKVFRPSEVSESNSSNYSAPFREAQRKRFVRRLGDHAGLKNYGVSYVRVEAGGQSSARLTKAAVPHMKPGSAIINTASINSDMPNPILLAYATTRGAIQNFTAGLAQLLAAGCRAAARQEGSVRLRRVLDRDALPDVPGCAVLGAHSPLSQRGHASSRGRSQARLLTKLSVLPKPCCRPIVIARLAGPPGTACS